MATGGQLPAPVHGLPGGLEAGAELAGEPAVPVQAGLQRLALGADVQVGALHVGGHGGVLAAVAVAVAAVGVAKAEVAVCVASPASGRPRAGGAGPQWPADVPAAIPAEVALQALVAQPAVRRVAQQAGSGIEPVERQAAELALRAEHTLADAELLPADQQCWPQAWWPVWRGRAGPCGQRLVR